MLMLWPLFYITMQWSITNRLELPVFLAPWAWAWLLSMVFVLTVPIKQYWVLGSLHWLFYLGSAAVFYTDDIFATAYLQGFASTLLWLLFQTFESYYARYKQALNAIHEAKVLEARIRPHFIFNVFNSLRALVDSNSVIAQGLDDSASLIRAVLQRQTPFVPYSQERDLLEQYLRLEYLRLEERLKIEWFVEDIIEDEDPQLPGFVLQPMVENAIRHGLEVAGGTIEIHVFKQGSYLEIKLVNKSGVNPVAGLGIAEKDIQTRLASLYDAQASYSRKQQGSLTSVIVRVPWSIT